MFGPRKIWQPCSGELYVVSGIPDPSLYFLVRTPLLTEGQGTSLYSIGLAFASETEDPGSDPARVHIRIFGRLLCVEKEK
jgi:hypothetical protein